MRIMCLDVGEKRIGVALSDPMGVIAQGATTIEARPVQVAVERVLRLIDEEEVGEVVIGLPKNMDSSVGERGRAAMEFAEALRRVTDVKVTLWDERLSTRQAERSLLEADVSRKKRKRVVDKMAAAIVLDSYLRWRSGASRDTGKD